MCPRFRTFSLFSTPTLIRSARWEPDRQPGPSYPIFSASLHYKPLNKKPAPSVFSANSVVPVFFRSVHPASRARRLPNFFFFFLFFLGLRRRVLRKADAPAVAPHSTSCLCATDTPACRGQWRAHFRAPGRVSGLSTDPQSRQRRPTRGETKKKYLGRTRPVLSPTLPKAHRHATPAISNSFHRNKTVRDRVLVQLQYKAEARRATKFKAPFLFLSPLSLVSFRIRCRPLSPRESCTERSLKNS